ncbi:MAG: hypothetical protein OQL28_16805 [Sedimenticola sp.]|nr:hypothetical protein [Sedimenticola sp.]
MFKRIAAAVMGLTITLAGDAAVADNADCYTPFNHGAGEDPTGLRQIARACAEPEISNLFYNRAYHAELLRKFRTLNRLQALKPNHNQTHYHTQRIYIGLAEAFARRAWQRGTGNAISQLNRQYDQSIEIAEYQLKGYDMLAAQSERQTGN